MDKNQEPEFLTVAQVAAKLQIHWQTVLSYIKAKKLKAVKIGNGYRIPREALAEFVNDNLTTNKKV